MAFKLLKGRLMKTSRLVPLSLSVLLLATAVPASPLRPLEWSKRAEVFNPGQVKKLESLKDRIKEREESIKDAVRDNERLNEVDGDARTSLHFLFEGKKNVEIETIDTGTFSISRKGSKFTVNSTMKFKGITAEETKSYGKASFDDDAIVGYIGSVKAKKLVARFFQSTEALRLVFANEKVSKIYYLANPNDEAGNRHTVNYLFLGYDKDGRLVAAVPQQNLRQPSVQ